jgi:hypothetical protein
VAGDNHGRRLKEERMALRIYQCVLLRAKRANFSDKIVFRPVDRFTAELDLDPEMGHTIRAALLTGARQHGGPEADVIQYRLTVLDPKNGRVLLEDFAAPSETGGH